jgi:hypothetical protein
MRQTAHTETDPSTRPTGRRQLIGPRPSDGAEGAGPVRHCDLRVRDGQMQWRQIRWALFVFPDISDVGPTEDPDLVRVFYRGRCPYPRIWLTELVQAGFDALPVEPSGHS